MKNITNKTKTILFASLIAAMVLPFSGMQFAEAEKQYCGHPESFYDNVIRGTGSPDYLVGTDGKDLIIGGGGADHLRGAHGNDCIIGGPGDDYIQAGEGNDTIYAGLGNDVIRTGGGNDTVFGGPGNDKLEAIGHNGSKILNGDGGYDICVSEEGNPNVDYSNCELTDEIVIHEHVHHTHPDTPPAPPTNPEECSEKYPIEWCEFWHIPPKECMVEDPPNWCKYWDHP